MKAFLRWGRSLFNSQTRGTAVDSEAPSYPPPPEPDKPLPDEFLSRSPTPAKVKNDRFTERELEEVREAKSVIYKMLPAVGMHGRGFSQEALIRGCFLIGSNPWDWTDHPDVLERRLEIMPARYRKKFERRERAS